MSGSISCVNDHGTTTVGTYLFSLLCTTLRTISTTHTNNNKKGRDSIQKSIIIKNNK